MTITEPAARTGLRLRPYLVVDGADAAIAFYARGLRRPRGRRPHPRRRRSGRPQRARDRRQRPSSWPTPTPSTASTPPIPRSGSPSTSRSRTPTPPSPEPSALGATVLQPVDDRFYGSRSGTLRDPFGHQWQIDAPGTVSTTQEDRDREMADGGYHYETVDLGERASVRPTHPHGAGGREGERARRRLLHGRRPRPRPSGGVLRGALRLGGAPERRGVPHRERLAPGWHRRLGHRAGRHAVHPGDRRDRRRCPRARARRHRARRGGPPVRRQRPLPRRPGRALPALAARARLLILTAAGPCRRGPPGGRNPDLTN